MGATPSQPIPFSGGAFAGWSVRFEASALTVTLITAQCPATAVVSSTPVERTRTERDLAGPTLRANGVAFDGTSGFELREVRAGAA